ncbi:MAG: PKD domain-containing protein, partial [Bacteroidia bacterium]
APQISVPDSVCPGEPVSFSVYGGSFNSFNWIFGDGATSNQSNPSHSYTSTGIKTVILTTTGNCGTQTTTKALKVSNLLIPQVSIWANPSTSTCPNVSISFDTYEFSSYLWNFGDGATATVKNPTHAYSTVGNKAVTLTVTNNCNQSATTTYTAVISTTPPPFPNWISMYAYQTLVCPNTEVGFNGPSGYTSYQWNFGDGSPVITSNDYYKYHTYGSTPGTYIASLKVTAPCGNDTTLYDTVIVSNNAPFPQNMTYSLSVNASPSCPNTSIGFQAPSGFNSYQWNFGDGTVITTTDYSTNHTYGNTLTTYTVSVKITNNCGNDTTLYNSVQINGNIPFPTGNSFKLTASPSTSCPNSDISLQAPYGYNSYMWMFGDGSPSITTQYSGQYHKYTTLGTYTASVKITNGCGNDTIISTTVSIQGNLGFPNNNFFVSHNPDPVCPNDMVNFNVPNGYSYYEWNFGDGSLTEIKQQSYNNHKFTGSASMYVVSVKIKNGCNNDTILYDTVHVNSNSGFGSYESLNFQSSQSSFCPQTYVTFNAPWGFSNYQWNFGDNTGSAFSTQSQFNHFYGNQIDTFTVSVKITNGCGQDTTLYTYVNTVSDMQFPNNNFNLNHNPDPVCPNDWVSFNSPGGYNYYEWNFGDGSPVLTGQQSHPNHKYTGTSQMYFVSLKIKNGCDNDTMLYDTVHVNNNVGFPNGNNFNLSSNEKICPSSYGNFNAPNGYSKYEWDFGDNSPLETTTSSSFNHLYGNQVASYTVSVKITNGCNFDTTLYTTLQVDNNIGFPNEDWFNVYANPNPACPNDMIGFSAPGGYNNYKWTFGDGDSIASSQSNVGHKYTTAGTYTYSVKIKNACDNDTVLYGQINVSTSGSNQNNLEIYTDNSVTSCPDELIEFGLNQNGYSNYYWYFSNGNSGFDTVTTTGNNIQHAFPAAGTYTVICKIINGCGDTIQGQKTVQVMTNSPISNNLSIEGSPNPSCPGDEVFFNIQSGQLTNEYIWDFGDGSPADTTIGTGISHVYTTAGTKTITVVAKNTCGMSKTLTLTQVVGSGNPPTLQRENGSPNWGAVTDDGGNNSTVGCAGDAVVFYFMGTATSNLWSFGDGVTQVATETMIVDGGDGSFPVTIIKHVFQNNGQYTIGLTLTNGCGLSTTDSTTITIGGGQAVNGDMTTSSPPYTTCAPIDFIAFGGSNYAWNFGDGATISSSSPTVSHTYANPGIYVASVVITNGCGNTATYSKSINVSGGNGPQVTLVSSFAPNCYGANNGMAIVTASGGTAPYTYLWNDVNAQTTETATGLSAGVYNVSVKDNIGCESVFAVSITDPAPIVASIATTPSTCGSQTGTATATIVSGGTAPYTYYWSPGATSTASVTNIGYGTYTVTINDNNGCQITKTATISDVNSATVDLDSTVSVSCSGGSNGAIYIDVTGTATYTYAWSNGATTQDITGLTAGTYSVQVSGNNGCHAVYTATVAEGTELSVTAVTTTAPTCGNFDGVATATATGGTSPYSYMWDSGSGNQTTAAATGLPAGSYTVTVTDSKGCVDSTAIALSNSNAPNITAVITDVTCNGNTDGAVNISVTGGTSPYLYTWNVPPPQTNTQDLNTLAAGSYFVFVNDAQGCLSVRTFTVAQPAVLVATASATTATCNANNATASVTVTGGTAPYTYLWNTTDTTQSVDSLAVGSYTATVTDDKGCTTTSSTSVSTSVPTPSICMVTVDSFSVNNEIYWDKTQYMNVDSFIVYREVSSGIYKRIGAVHADSLSMLTDTARSVGPANGDPNVTTYRYKLQIRDVCGNYSEKSLYHNTIFINFDEVNGTFSWNPSYSIENEVITAVANYVLIYDTTSTDTDWFQVGVTAGTQNQVTDTDYNNHKNHPEASWRVKTDWSIQCEPTRAPIVTSRSNIKKPSIVIGLENVAKTNNSLNIYPNPTNGTLTIELLAYVGTNKVFIMNALGQMMYADSVQGIGGNIKKQVNVSAYPKGIYSVVLENGTQRTVKKLVIN